MPGPGFLKGGFLEVLGPKLLCAEHSLPQQVQCLLLPSPQAPSPVEKSESSGKCCSALSSLGEGAPFVQQKGIGNPTRAGGEPSSFSPDSAVIPALF